MKKIYLLVFIGFIAVMLSGCYNYSKGSNFGRLLDVRFFDEDYQELPGQYYDDNLVFYTATQVSLRLHNEPTLPLNAIAPTHLIYSADFEEHANVIVCFSVRMNNGYQFVSLGLRNHGLYHEEDFDKVEVEDNIIHLYLAYNDISGNEKIIFDQLRMVKEFEEGPRYRNGSFWVEGRTYISGFAFNAPEIVDDLE